MGGCLRTISMTNSLLKVRLTSARTSEEMDGALKIVLVMFLISDSFHFYIDHFYQIDGLLGPKLLASLLRPVPHNFWQIS